MLFGRRRRVLAALVVLGLFAAVGVAGAASKGHQRAGLTLAQIKADQGSQVRVIVLLKNQFTNLPPTSSGMSSRAAALSSAQSGLQSAVKSAGGKIDHSYKTVDAFAATVSAAERASLASNSSVAEILPDSWVPNPNPVTGATQGKTHAASSRRAAGAAARAADVKQQLCPAKPSHPIVAPEGLKLIHANAAQRLVNGAGVKVAFVADGLNPDNPDFIAPNGRHVIADYQDFTGQGANSPTDGGEAYGDASTIAGQGDVVYDLSKFVNPAHPLPAHCNIVIKGVAPGVSLYAMKVFPNNSGAFSSMILQGLDYAVAVDHVNVLNESFGGATLPDTDQDVEKDFNQLAEAAGVTVTVSTGDQGTASTIGSPASGPAGISAGATTQFQGLAQTTRGAYQLKNKGWLNDNIAEFSSGGFTQGGATLDLVAPGNESYEPCDPNLTLYSDCHNFAGAPSNISTFGGTSESSPMTAGVAALVIQAYRQTHGGSSPSPALVKQIITSNVNDLGIPSDEQGAGELDALAAVKAAESIKTRSATGHGRLVSPSQLDLAAGSGSSTGGSVTVSNDGAHSQTFDAHLRTLDQELSNHSGAVTLSTTTDPTFVDNLGTTQSYKEITFTVPAGANRLDGSIADPDPNTEVNLTLFDPSGKMAAYTYQGAGVSSDFGHISVRNPKPGTWTAAFFTPQSGGYSGAVDYDLSTSAFGTLGSVTPSSVTLAPGASTTLHVGLNAPSQAGDYSRDLQISSSTGKTTVVPVVVRSLVNLTGGQGTFTGTITGGDGDGAPAQTIDYGFDVPAGAPAVDVNWTLPNDPNTSLEAVLTAPDGEAVASQAPVESTTGVETMQLYHANPMAGRYTLTLFTFNPAGGTAVAGAFHGTVSLQAPKVSSTGVPDSASTTLPSGSPVTATVKVSNTGPSPLNAFVDPRLTTRTLYDLLPVSQATGVTLPLNTAVAPPEWVVPTQTNLLDAAAQATAPITFDWGFLDPDIEAVSSGDNAYSAFATPEATPGAWFMAPSLIGPDSGVTSGTVNTGIAAQALTFDGSVTSSTGDPQLADVNPSPPAANPVAINPGSSSTISVTFTPSAPSGTVVHGYLYVDDDIAELGAVNEITAIPYEYKVG